MNEIIRCGGTLYINGHITETLTDKTGKTPGNLLVQHLPECLLQTKHEVQ